MFSFSTLQLDIVGHSGDSIEVPFVESSNPPANDKERLQVLKVGPLEGYK